MTGLRTSPSNPTPPAPPAQRCVVAGAELRPGRMRSALLLVLLCLCAFIADAARLSQPRLPGREPALLRIAFSATGSKPREAGLVAVRPSAARVGPLPGGAAVVAAGSGPQALRTGLRPSRPLPPTLVAAGWLRPVVRAPPR